MKNFSVLLFAISALAGLSACSHIEVDRAVDTGGVLEDAILIASPSGGVPREVKILGDIDLSQLTGSFSFDLDDTNSTHWWLIGHVGGKVAFTSTASLDGVDLYAIEPYSIASPMDWNIPSNLDAYANGMTFSLDWWAQTVNNHSSHVAADTGSATLWQFDTRGSSIGTVTIRLHVPD